MNRRTPSAAGVLRKAWQAKKKSRSGSSLRSLAQKLKCSPAFLSKVLSGKAKVPADKLEQYARIFELDEYAKKALHAAVATERLGSLDVDVGQIRTGRRLSRQLDQYEELRGQHLHERVLGAWYHLAILDLMTCETFVPQVDWIARELGLTAFQVESSLRLLMDAGLAAKTNDGWVKTDQKINFPTSQSTAVVRSYQKQILQCAIKNLMNDTDPSAFARRLITSASIAVNSSKIPEAKAYLMTALTECIEILTDGPCDSVYSLGIQLFPQQKSQNSKAT